jgi:predicted metal-dependent phosphoesterase TrpH
MDYDFHLHTEYSYDATAAVEDILKAAVARGVTAIAVTDHHNMDGFKETTRVAKKYPGVRVILGMEATVNTEFGPIDIVCIGLDVRDAAALERPVVSRYREWMREYDTALLRGMEKLGIPFSKDDADALLAARPERLRKMQGKVRMSNTALRNELLHRGVIAAPGDYPELLRRIGEEAFFPPYPPADDILPEIAQRASVLSLAHPQGRLNEMGNDEFMHLVRRLQLSAVEAGHLSHTVEQRDAYEALCAGTGIIPTAGTDAHHPHEYTSLLGAHRGKPEWREAVIHRLDARQSR